MRKYLAALALLAGTASGQAHAGSLSTDVSINLGSVFALSCFDEVDVNLSSETYLTAISRNNNPRIPDRNRNAIGSAGNLDVNTGGQTVFNRPRFQTRDRVRLDLDEVCAFRSFGSGAGARVQIELLEETLEASGGGAITVERAAARDSATGSFYTNQYRIRPNELGAGIVRGIDVRLRLDMRNATEPGLYSSATDGTFRITVISAP